MTETTKDIFEKHQIRKTKKQKTAFIEYITDLCQRWGYSAGVERGALGARNIVVGDPARAKVVYTAHYDTCSVLPFPNFITPKCFALYLLYQIAIILAFFVVAALLGAFLGFLLTSLGAGATLVFWTAEFVYFALLFLILFGPPNKHTANDNTSGITLLIDIMRDLPEEDRDSVAFIFFDLEEMGLFGSSSFARKHKEQMKDKLLLNFDCVSDGDHILFVLRKNAKQHRTAIEQAFAAVDDFKVEVTDKGVFYPSDQIAFPKGVGVASLRSAKNGILYMNRIHTKRDVIYREENIAFLKQGALELPRHL